MIHVDDMRMYAQVGNLRARWSHLFSDESSKELIEFALKIGLKVSWIQDSRGFIHFDVTDSKRAEAIRAGAHEVSWRDLTDFFHVIGGRYHYKNLSQSDVQRIRDKFLGVAGKHG